MISFILEIDPVAKGRPRFSSAGSVHTPCKTRRFENSIGLMMKKHRPKELLTGPLSLTLAFYLKPPVKAKRALPTGKPDLDNLIKAVKDSMKGIMWNDDAQVIYCHAMKFYDWSKRQGSIHVTIEEIQEGTS